MKLIRYIVRLYLSKFPITEDKKYIYVFAKKIPSFSTKQYKFSKKALDEFFLDKPETPIIIPDKSGSAIVVKL